RRFSRAWSSRSKAYPSREDHRDRCRLSRLATRQAPAAAIQTAGDSLALILATSAGRLIRISAGRSIRAGPPYPSPPPSRPAGCRRPGAARRTPDADPSRVDTVTACWVDTTTVGWIPRPPPSRHVRLHAVRPVARGRFVQSPAEAGTAPVPSTA